MKKTLIAAAATVACASAFSQVTLYGVADAGVTRVSGYAQGSVTQLNSGIMEGSRWGLRGAEDLGGDYRAIFTLESRVELDTGGQSNRTPSGNQLPDRLTAGLPGAVAAALSASFIGPTLGVNLSNATFDRQSWLGLVTPIGGFLMGRQYTPAYEALATFDIMATESALSAGQVAGIPTGVDIRYNNALQYRIVQGPWNAALMYGFGEGANSSSSRLLGINTLYKTSAFSAGFGYNTKKNSAGEQALRSALVGASATQGSWTLSGVYARLEEPNASGGPELSRALTANGLGAFVPTILDNLKQDADLMHIGLRYNLGSAGKVTVAYTKLNDKRTANADTASYGIAYTYPLSKRTNLNAVLTRFDNSGSGQAAPGGAGYLGGVTGVAGRDATSIALGVRHAF
jgi:predicted porin